MLVFAAWGNLHGGFIWGILLLMATIVGEALDNLLDNQPSMSWKETCSLALWSILAGLTISINPNGISLWRLPFDQVQVSLSITEWLSPDFHQFYTHPLLWLFFLLIISVAYSGKRMSFTDLLKGLGFTYLFFVAQRNMGPYVIILLPIIARHLTSAVKSFSNVPIVENIKKKVLQEAPTKQLSAKFYFIVNTTLVSFLAAFALVNAYVASTPQRIEEKIPLRAVQWIKDNRPRGPIFNSYNWGGYLTWELREYPVFIDGRADLYGDEIIGQWLDVVNATENGWEILERWGVRLILLEPSRPIVRELPSHGWKQVYQDETAVIFVR
ncbi:MAG: hypothetical protein KJ606_04340 [Chloroflexi bacterium]|nr:hypothetical protein [Chloroflexota bacterium]